MDKTFRPDMKDPVVQEAYKFVNKELVEPIAQMVVMGLMTNAKKGIFLTPSKVQEFTIMSTVVHCVVELITDMQDEDKKNKPLEKAIELFLPVLDRYYKVIHPVEGGEDPTNPGSPSRN